jgi:hypothetical protein
MLIVWVSGSGSEKDYGYCQGQNVHDNLSLYMVGLLRLRRAAYGTVPLVSGFSASGFGISRSLDALGV